MFQKHRQVFEVYDSKNNLKQTITTNDKGIAETDLLPYGKGGS